MLQRAWDDAPDAKEYCEDFGWCGNIIKVRLTQAQNTWVAEEQHGGGNLPGHTQVWKGSFTAKPGCNLIEIK